MMTFNDIKRAFLWLTSKQQELVYELTDNASLNIVWADDLADYASELLKKGELNSFSSSDNYDEQDYEMVIGYLKFASEYHLPKVYVLDCDDENRFLTRDDFKEIDFDDYIDVQSKMINLWASIYDFITDPIHNDEPDLYEYNDQYFKREMLDYIRQHNSELRYYFVDDERLGDYCITTTKDEMNRILDKLGGADTYDVDVCNYEEISEMFTDEEIEHYIYY